MRLVSINNIKPQAYLAKTVYEDSGRIILVKGTQLNENYITRLKNLNVGSVYVDDGKAGAIGIDYDVSEDTRLQVFKILRMSLPKIRAGESFESRRIRKTVNDIIDEILRIKELMVYLTDIKSLRDHTFDHSVNVCILSLLTALSMGYDHQQLLELGAGALLHDVGKAAVLDKIVNNTKLFIPDEYQQIQKHVDYGYEALKKAVSIGSFAADVAWQHHERYNGSGYPRKLAGNDIHEHARIVAVADVYNALSTARPYREGLLLHEAEEAIRRSRGTDFDPDIAAEFIRITVPFPLGSMVLLNSGVKGIVVSINADFPTRPRIQMLYNDKGDQVEGIHIVDLMRDQALFVQKLT